MGLQMGMNTQENMLNRLWEICPHTRNNIHSYSEMTPDNITSAFELMNVQIKWCKVPNWESFSDTELLAKTVNLPESGMLFISSDSNFAKPAYIQVTSVNEFVGEYLVTNEMCFFSGDVIAISGINTYVYLFHHEGLYANIVSPI
jgi:hypothetical protein